HHGRRPGPRDSARRPGAGLGRLLPAPSSRRFGHRGERDRTRGGAVAGAGSRWPYLDRRNRHRRLAFRRRAQHWKGRNRMRRVLLVEDNPDLAFGLRTSLEVEGYEVLHAETGSAGVTMARDGT